MPCTQKILGHSHNSIAMRPQVPSTIRVFEARFRTRTVVRKRSVDRIRMVQRDRVNKLDRAPGRPEDRYAKVLMIFDLKEQQLVDKLPMPAKPKIGCLAQD